MSINMQFPKDHCAHPDCKTEWWYFAGIGDLEDFGKTNYHISFFRKFSSKLKKEIYFAHFGLNKNGDFEFEQKISDHAKADNKVLQVFVDNWDLTRFQNRFLVSLDKRITFTQIAQKQPVIHRDGYYSISDMKIHGVVNEKRFKGKGWFDHEFNNNSTIEMLTCAYKWFALQLKEGIEIMIYLFPKLSAKSSGTITFPKGESKKILPGDYCLAENNGNWIFELPGYGMKFNLQKKNENKITESLGPDYIEGTFDIYSRAKIGQGFFEITQGV